MKFTKGYKYQLVEDECLHTNILPPHDISLGFIRLYRDGRLYLLNGYASDGPSGPTIDWPKRHVMRGAFGHDALCKLLRHGELPQFYGRTVDYLAQKWWIEDGMSKCRAKLWHSSIRKHGGFAHDPRHKRKVYEV